MEEAVPEWRYRSSSTRAWRLKVLELESERQESGAIDESTEKYYREAMHAAAQQCGPDHPEVAEAATYLADLLMHFQRYVEAEALYRRAMQIYAATHGDEHMVYSMALRNLAVAMKARGKTEAAERLRQQARNIFG